MTLFHDTGIISFDIFFNKKAALNAASNIIIFILGGLVKNRFNILLVKDVIF